MVSGRLAGAGLINNFFRMGTYFLPVVKFIVSDACFDVVDVGSIFVRGSFGQRFIDHSWPFARGSSLLRLALRRFLLILFGRLTHTALIVTFPVLGTSF